MTKSAAIARGPNKPRAKPTTDVLPVRPLDRVMVPKVGQKYGSDPERTSAIAREFCRLISETANVYGAARELGIAINYFYSWRRDDPVFRAMWDEADTAATAFLEEVAVRRATEGTQRPIYQGGKLVGHEVIYSDSLLSTLLGAHNPRRFRQNFNVEHAGSVAIGAMSEDQINERIAQLLKAAGPGGTSIIAGSAGEGPDEA